MRVTHAFSKLFNRKPVNVKLSDDVACPLRMQNFISPFFVQTLEQKLKV
nr:MAG TPA: hypothetical protein [Caudoviricetes sp.]